MRQQRTLLDRVAELAGGHLARSWQQVDTTAEFEALRPALLELITGLVDAYGEAAAGLAADYYDTSRDAARARGRYTPRLPEVVTAPVRDHLDKEVGISLGGIVQGEPEMTKRHLASAVDLHVKGAYRRTIAFAVSRDPARAAWQRVGTGTGCRFCRDMAGQVYTSPDSADSHFHGHCRCMSMPIWLG